MSDRKNTAWLCKGCGRISAEIHSQCPGCLGGQWSQVDVNPPEPPRCKHGVHGTDCVECFHTPAPGRDDEADAANYEPTHDLDLIIETKDSDGLCECILNAFLAGRKGSVPASEVEHWKAEVQKAYERGYQEATLSFPHTIEVAREAARKEERERCIAAIEATSVYELDKWLAGPKHVRYLILNPAPSETEGG